MALETSAFGAWPSLGHDEIFEGWRLRLSGGDTKRINSANATRDAVDLDGDQIAEIEQRYFRKGLPAIFRITSVAAPVNIDRILEERGYRFVDPTWVMTAALQDPVGNGDLPCELDPASWLEAYRHISGGGQPSNTTHLGIMRTENDGCVLAVEYVAGSAACCGIAVLSGQHVGLFSIATQAQHQRTGLATKLCAKLLRWGQLQGATTGYLQVGKANSRAIGAYEKLGFKRAYGYWYRVRPSE